MKCDGFYLSKLSYEEINLFASQPRCTPKISLTDLGISAYFVTQQPKYDLCDLGRDLYMITDLLTSFNSQPYLL